MDRLSAGVGRICAPVSLIVPAYLIMVMGGSVAFIVFSILMPILKMNEFVS